MAGGSQRMLGTSEEWSSPPCVWNEDASVPGLCDGYVRWGPPAPFLGLRCGAGFAGGHGYGCRAGLGG